MKIIGKGLLMDTVAELANLVTHDLTSDTNIRPAASTTRRFGGAIVFHLPLMSLDESSSEIGVLCPNENADVEDLGKPGLTLSAQVARDALTAQGILDDLRLVWIFQRIGGNEFVPVRFSWFHRVGS